VNRRAIGAVNVKGRERIAEEIGSLTKAIVITSTSQIITIPCNNDSINTHPTTLATNLLR